MVDDICVSVIRVEKVDLQSGPDLVKIHVLSPNHPFTCSYVVSANFTMNVLSRNA